MAGINNAVTIVGNVTDDPELRFTPSGLPVATFTVAVNSRIRKNDQWEDRLDGFFRCSCWRDMAENVAESLTKGTRVMVVGRLQQQRWEDKEGGKHSRDEVQVDEVGPTLKWATVQVTKSQRSSGGSGGGGGDWGNSGGSGGGGGGGGDWGNSGGGGGSPAPVGGPVNDEGGF
ncbi:MAG: single-strand DNA-binding protein [Actinomycetota bacterium]|jgi:single-strand DNA-binding protein|nr:single-strand DNA-binding protein [Actinomycetota bacterium]